MSSAREAKEPPKLKAEEAEPIKGSTREYLALLWR